MPSGLNLRRNTGARGQWSVVSGQWSVAVRWKSNVAHHNTH